MHPDNGKLLSTNILCIFMWTHNSRKKFLPDTHNCHFNCNILYVHVAYVEQSRIQNVPVHLVYSVGLICWLAIYLYFCDQRLPSLILFTNNKCMALAARWSSIHWRCSDLWMQSSRKVLSHQIWHLRLEPSNFPHSCHHWLFNNVQWCNTTVHGQSWVCLSDWGA